MYVKAHELFQRFYAGLQAQPAASVVHSLAQSPQLGDFLNELDPALSLDWSGQDFQGLPSLREKVLARCGMTTACRLVDSFVTANAVLEWQRPAAGLIGFCRLHAGLNSVDFARQLMQEPYRTFVIPGSAYGFPQHLRLGFGGGAGGKLAEGLKYMQLFLDELGAGT